METLLVHESIWEITFIILENTGAIYVTRWDRMI